MQNQNQSKNTDQRLKEHCDTVHNSEMLHGGARSHNTKANPSFFALFAFQRSVLVDLSKELGNGSPFCGAVDTTVLVGLLVRYTLGFKSRVDALSCVLHHPFMTDSSNSPLV